MTLAELRKFKQVGYFDRRFNGDIKQCSGIIFENKKGEKFAFTHAEIEQMKQNQNQGGN